MKATARNWIIQAKIGLLTEQELIQLADDYIRDHDEFPDWMIAIAANESLRGEEQLDLVLTPVTEHDGVIIANEMLTLLSSGKRNIDQIAAASEQMYLLLDWGSPMFNQFIWISDEHALIKLGVKSADGYQEQVMQMLNNIATS